MPNIREYNAPALDIRPTEIGVEATAAAARRGGAFFNQAAQAVDTLGQRIGSATNAVGGVFAEYQRHEDHRQISAGAAHGIDLAANLDQTWNATIKDPNLDPNDPSVAAKFREQQLEPALEKFRESFTTEASQQWADDYANRVRQHLTTKTSADMSKLAGIAVRNNIVKGVNTLTGTVYNDPSSLGFSADSFKAMVDGLVDSSPTLSAVDAASARSEIYQKGMTQIVKGAVIGAIRNNPEAGTSIAQDPRYSQYITGVEVKQFQDEAKRVDREARAFQSWQRKEEKEQKQDASEAAANDTLKKIYIDKNLSPQDIVRNDDLLPATKERLISILERETKPETDARVSNRNYVDLLRRIREGEITDVGPIYDARIKGDLNRADFNQAIRDVTEIRSPEGQRLNAAKGEVLKAVKPAIDKSNPLMGKIDPDGPLNLYRFERDLSARIDAYRKAGKDPYDLFDPAKPDFVGRPEALAPYQKPLSESLRDQTRRLTGQGATGQSKPAVPQCNPGETADDYLKRIGVK